LLNAVLTVRAHQANSHKDHGWEKLTDAVIAWLNKNTAGTVFMLWGSYAQKKGACIDKAGNTMLLVYAQLLYQSVRNFLSGLSNKKAQLTQRERATAVHV